MKRVAGVTVDSFNAMLGTGELQLRPEEAWMMSSGRLRLCQLDGEEAGRRGGEAAAAAARACYAKNHTTDQKTGVKRAPQRAELHERNCPQRRLLEVQRAITNNLRVRVVSGEGAAAKGSKKRAAPSDDAEGAPGKRAAASEE